MFRLSSGLYSFETQHVLYVDRSGERALLIAAGIERIKKNCWRDIQEMAFLAFRSLTVFVENKINIFYM